MIADQMRTNDSVLKMILLIVTVQHFTCSEGRHWHFELKQCDIRFAYILLTAIGMYIRTVTGGALFYRRVWIRSSSSCSLSWMKTRAGIWRRILRCLARTGQILKMKTLRRAIWCMVINVFGKECVVLQDVFLLILNIPLYHKYNHFRAISCISWVSYSAFFCCNLPFWYSCKRTHVWEPSRVGDVCRGQS